MDVVAALGLDHVKVHVILKFTSGKTLFKTDWFMALDPDVTKAQFTDMITGKAKLLKVSLLCGNEIVEIMS